MASLSAAPAVPEAVSPASSARSAVDRHPALLAVGSALLLWLAFPPVDAGHLAWFALVPLFLLVQGPRSRRATYFGAWLGGEVFWVLSIEWVRRTDPSAWLAWLVMASFLSLWWPAFLFLARWGTTRLRLPLMIAAPVSWVTLEFVRAFALTGFPWYYLAHSQYRFPLVIQVADLTGAYGLSFVVAMTNALLVDLIRLPVVAPTSAGPRVRRAMAVRIGAGALVLGGVLAYGLARVQTASFRPGPRIALLQSNIEQRLKMKNDGRAIVETYARLVARARDMRPRPDLIVWPETSFPYRVIKIDPGVTRARLAELVHKVTPKDGAEEWLREQNVVSQILHGITDEAGVPMVVGGTTNHFTPGAFSRYNSALLLRPKVAEIVSYHKLHLVPFGEYVPLLQSFPWLTRLTPYHGDLIPSLSFGSGPSWFDQGTTRYATAICFEDSVPHVVRRFFAEAPGGHQPDVLLNISNDGWFGGSSELDAHLAVSVFRAVENRVPLARAVNTGISAIVDGNGTILQSVPKMKEDVLVGVAPLDDRRSLYSSWGDWFPLTCLAITIGLFPVGWMRRGPVKEPESTSSPRLPKPR